MTRTLSNKMWRQQRCLVLSAVKGSVDYRGALDSGHRPAANDALTSNASQITTELQRFVAMGVLTS